MKKQLKKYFIPSKENDNQPASLKDNVLRSILLVAISFELVALALLLPVFNGKLNFLSAVLPSVLVTETNQERIERNLGELTINDQLVAAAQLKANDMAEKGYFAHVTPDGKQPWYFLGQASYEYEVAGENLAVNFIDSKKVHQAWMESPTHRDNILKDKYTEIGIATARGEYKGRPAIFVAQFFGKPKLIVENVDESDFYTENEIPTVTTTVDDEPEEVAGASVGESVGATDPINPADSTVLADSTAPANSAPISQDINQESQIAQNVNQSDNSLINRVISSPITLISLILSIFLILVSVALLLKIFIKVKIQYPKMILNSTLVISVLASFYLLNSLLVDLFGEII